MSTYLGLGDSITVGVGSPPGAGYFNILSSYLQASYPIVYTKKLAENGLTSAGLLNALTRNPCLRNYFSDANLITLYIGGNDLNMAFIKFRLSNNPQILYQAIQRFSANYTNLLSLCRKYSNATILTATLYNPFPYSALATKIIPLMNTAIASIAQSYNVPVVDIYTAFLGKECQLVDGYRNGTLKGFIPLVQKSPIHPNGWGHKLIADCFWQTLNQPNV